VIFMTTTNLAWIHNYWGKARPDETEAALALKSHPLAWHMLDVAAVAEAILQVRPSLSSRLSNSLNLDKDNLVPFLTWLAAIHDLGKFARAFQSKVPEFWYEQDKVNAGIDFAAGTHHDADGQSLMGVFCTETKYHEHIWQGIHPASFQKLTTATFSHHGEPASSSTLGAAGPRSTFGPGFEDASECLTALASLLLPAVITVKPPRERAINLVTPLIAGLVTSADWLGSSQRWFPYEAPHGDVKSYWLNARVKAAKAVNEAGYRNATISKSSNFSEITGREGEPTPLQSWALSSEIMDGPTLFLLEDVTGAGKTEAAHILVHRLISAGKASGAYWAMPTMATANAMYNRQSAMLENLFDPTGPRPSLALAHGQVALHQGFRASRTDFGRDERPLGRDVADVTASAACAAFLADDKRLSLLADVGAGTIDQAVLAVLPSRFNTVRLLGLAEKVLVIDEAHAYDPFVDAELKRLLEFHAALGGSAIVLSATLTNKQRASLVSSWQSVLARPQDGPPPESVNKNEARYPLATIAYRDAVMIDAIQPAQWSSRETPIALVDNADAILAGLKATLDAGGCAAWVRNTVDDVLEAASFARKLGIDPIIFHARFAQTDRQQIEARVMDMFGSNSSRETRQGKLVIATQVIEQSLDLDFDQLTSDLAPIDLILQRAGRMRRHAGRVRPSGIGNAMLVFSPRPITDAKANWVRNVLPGSAAVYRDHGVLWRTARELENRGCIVTPDEVRSLVESVHAGVDCPDELLPSVDRTEGEGKGNAALAQNQLLELGDGYSPGANWESELKISTRLTTAQTVIRLAKRNKYGVIIPWAEAPMNAKWQEWPLSEVKAGPRVIPLDAISPASIASELIPICAKWGRFEREIPVCVLESNGDGGWVGSLESEAKGTVYLGYDASSGLRVAEAPSTQT
jgi:CRISPR-associated endonuclease/helicase Cas3